MKIAVVTVAANRSAHLRRQLEGLRRSGLAPDVHIVVSIGDAEVAEVIAEAPCLARVVMMERGAGRLPVAAARNVGADAALACGADLLVFLDVDCIPSRALIERYAWVATRYPDLLLNGPVTYLPEPGPEGYDVERLEQRVVPHPARPFPADHETVVNGAHELFWSLSFGVRAAAWRRIGGFYAAYRGYGGEDADFGQCAARASVPMAWVGGAHAFHQHHPVSEPPVEHLDDILLNAGLFHERWGWWPMRGWLDAFEQLGLVRYDAATDRWLHTSTTHAAEAGRTLFTQRTSRAMPYPRRAPAARPRAEALRLR